MNRTLIRAILPLALAGAAASAVADTAPFEVRHLDNGLTVLLSPNDAHPVVALSMFVTTGGRTEDEYYQGSLHYIEHLVFKGNSPNLAPTEFRKTMSLLGRESGGWTWDDEINFGFEAPKENFREALGVFREALLDLTFEEQWFEDEKRVVFQEMERGFERPDNLIYNYWDELAFTVHPYGRAVIGSEKAVRELEMTRTERYYRDRFSPNHILLVVAGDFDADDMMTWIDAEWGDRKPGPESFELGLPEPEQKGPREREDFLLEATSAIVLTGVVGPEGPHADTPALELLTELLNHDTIGLPQFLIEQEEWATSVSAYHYPMRDHATTQVFARVAPENVRSVRAFIQDFFLSFDVTAVPEDVFEEAKRAFIAREARARATFAERAERLGLLVSRRGPEQAASYMADVAALTRADVQAAKAAWIHPRALTTATIYPESFDPATATDRAVVMQPPADVPVPNLDVPGALQATGDAPIGYRVVEESGGVVVMGFDNGLTLVVRPTNASELLAVSARVLGGQWVEPSDQPGINRVTAELGMRATRRWSAEGFGRLLARHAVDASAHVSVGSRANTSRNVDYRDSGGHHAYGLADQAPLLLAILKETLFFPRFETRDVEKVKSDLVDEIRRLEENNLEYIKQEFYRHAYAGHPYGRPTIGTEEVVQALTVADVQAFHAANWVPARTVVSIVGDVVPADIANWIATHWTDVPRTEAAPVVPLPAPAWSPPSERQLLDLGKDQWTVNWGRPGVLYNDPEHVVSRVVSRIAGNDHFYRYVYEEGVSYRSWIGFWGNTFGPGTWILENDVQRERFDEVLDMFDADLARYADEGFTDDEIADAKQQLINSDILGRQDNAVLAWSLAVAVGNGSGAARITDGVEAVRGVANADVRRMARDIFRPDGILRLVQK